VKQKKNTPIQRAQQVAHVLCALNQPKDVTEYELTKTTCSAICALNQVKDAKEEEFTNMTCSAICGCPLRF
jgi:hypothetical protein